MKLIDEQGRLGGKINIFDLTVILLIIFGLAGAYYKFFYINKLEGEVGTPQKAQVGFIIEEVSTYTADAINVGDIVKELNSNTEIGTITKKEVRTALDKTGDAEGNWHVSPIADKRDVIIYIETTGNYDPDMKLGSVNGKVGAKIVLKGPKFQVESYIIGVDPE